MEKLQEKKARYKKYQGLEMNDIQIAETMKELQKTHL